MGPHLRTHATNWVSLCALSAGDWVAVAELADQTARLLRANAGSQFCSAAASNIVRGAIVHALAGRADEARALLRRFEEVSLSKEARDTYVAVPLTILVPRDAGVVVVE